MSVRLYAMTCGWMTMPFNFFMQGAEGWLAIPIPSYLIVHPNGSVLFDTGLEQDLQTTDKGIHKKALGIFDDLVKPEFKPGENVAERLRAFGIEPDKIDYLVNSHLHFDHCGGNALIGNARLVIQRREWEAGSTPELIAENSYMPRHYDLGHDKVLVDGEYDLFGDGTVTLFPTAGHTPGHQSMRVRLSDGDIVVTADACYMRQVLDKLILPDPMVVRSADAMIAAFKRLRELEQQGALLIFGHDPVQWQKLNDGPIRELTCSAVREAAKVVGPVPAEPKRPALAE